MMDECRYCASERVVPVLDVRIEESPTAGNKYRTRCLGCERWLPMTSADTFETHLRPHILPKSADPEADDPTIPLEEWDRAERFQDALDRLEDYRDRDRPYALVDDVDQDDAGDVEADVDADGHVDGQPVAADGSGQIDDQADESINRFECPATGCDAENDGHPDECPECGAVYDW